MKRSLFVVFCLATMVYAGAAYADILKPADCIEMMCPVATIDNPTEYSVLGQDATGCNRYTDTCYSCNGNWKVYDCKDCKSGWTHSTETIKIFAIYIQDRWSMQKNGLGHEHLHRHKLLRNRLSRDKGLCQYKGTKVRW